MADESKPPDESRAIVLAIPISQIDKPVCDVKPINCKPPAIEVDTSAHFVTDKTYTDRNELIDWVRREAAKLRFTVVILRSDYGSDRRKQYFVLGCERGGVYKPTNKKLKFEDTGTRKSGCPFRLRGYFHASKEWHLTVVSGLHNHVLDKELEGHLVAGRLKPQEKELLDEMTRNLVPPRNIISTLKERDAENVTAIKQVYNARHRLKLATRASRTEMQHLLKCLEDNNYVFKVRTVGESDTVQDIFFAHPKSVNLFNTFPIVLLMDSTYKTNRYSMPLFEIVGVTSTEKTYCVGFAFLSNEKEDNFTWALQQCLSLLRSEDIRPKVIVTDRDAALMNAVAQVFPNSAALVCRFHVKKNVSSKCKLYCKVKDGEKVKQLDVWNTVMNSFEDVLDSPTEDAYVEAVLEFRKVCERWPRFVNYVQTTVLDTDKERVVNAWTDSFMHMGNTTTNRVESSHGVLKKYLLDGHGDLAKGWESIHKMLINQFTELQTSFGKSLSVVEHRYETNHLYSLLFYKISRNALDFIYKEAKRVEQCGMDSNKCGCMIRKTFGLPCACVIGKKMKNKLPIRLDEVNSHWKKLAFHEDEGREDDFDDYSCLAEWQAIQKRLKTVDVSMKAEIRNQLRQIAFPESTSLKPPVESAKSKGAKKKGVRVDRSTSRDPSYWEHVDAQFPETQASQTKPSVSKTKPSVSQIDHIEHMPKFMHRFIENIVDVKGDGYCGYRVIAFDNGNTENDFELIKLNMLRELRLHRATYLKVYGSEERLNFITNALYPPKRKSNHGVAPMEKWFTFPDMGHIVASHYNKVVVELTKHGISETFFPLRGSPPGDPSSRIICLGLIPAHFVYVKLKDGCPIPPTCLEWRNHRSEEAAEWEYSFLDRQSKFVELMKNESGNKINVGVGYNIDDPIEL